MIQIANSVEPTLMEPETDPETKRAVLLAENEDTIRVDTLGECMVVQRHDTYYGPKLRIEPEDEDEDDQYLLTAPGPQSELLLWEQDRDALKWQVQAEVTAELVDWEQYDICEQCGNPLKTIRHRRRRAIGACTR